MNHMQWIRHKIKKNNIHRIYAIDTSKLKSESYTVNTSEKKEDEQTLNDIRQKLRRVTNLESYAMDKL